MTIYNIKEIGDLSVADLIATKRYAIEKQIESEELAKKFKSENNEQNLWLERTDKWNEIASLCDALLEDQLLKMKLVSSTI